MLQLSDSLRNVEKFSVIYKTFSKISQVSH